MAKQMDTILFEDTAVGQLAPITLTRPAWAISCASFRLIDWVTGNSRRTQSIVRPHLRSLQQNDWPGLSDSTSGMAGPVLMINARIAPTIASFNEIQSLMSTQVNENQIVVLPVDQALAAAIVPGSIISQIADDSECDRLEDLNRIAQDNSMELVKQDHSLCLFNYPHDVIREHMNGCRDAIEFRIKQGGYREASDGVFVAQSKQSDPSETDIPQDACFDTTDGPVVFEQNVRIGPFCFFRGPVYIGANSKISEHSSIKDAVAISHTCKMGGEIEGVQTEAWSNKQHFGFLGHSYIGSWINLGAGTCNSDLKNTYGTINMVYNGSKISTGMQFVGCVMGDYSRTAINTSIFTGKIIGVGSTVYGMTPHNVPSFVNCAQQLNQYGVLPPEVLASIQGRMFQRRNVTQRPCDVQLIDDAFALTTHERDSKWTTEPIPF